MGFSSSKIHWCRRSPLISRFRLSLAIDFKRHSVEELGLRAETPVGTSFIDAHAGGVGVMESIAVLDSETKEYDKDAKV